MMRTPLAPLDPDSGIEKTDKQRVASDRLPHENIASVRPKANMPDGCANRTQRVLICESDMYG